MENRKSHVGTHWVDICYKMPYMGVIPKIGLTHFNRSENEELTQVSAKFHSFAINIGNLK